MTTCHSHATSRPSGPSCWEGWALPLHDDDGDDIHKHLLLATRSRQVSECARGAQRVPGQSRRWWVGVVENCACFAVVYCDAQVCRQGEEAVRAQHVVGRG